MQILDVLRLIILFNSKDKYQITKIHNVFKTNKKIHAIYFASNIY